VGDIVLVYNNSCLKGLIITQDMPVDPLEPPKFRHKKVPRASGSPPVPVMHSPPRALTAKDQQEWKIPPCISNWKNPKGYTIPLDKRLAADGRGLQTTTINEGFGKLMESLVTAEQQARQAVELRTQARARCLSISVPCYLQEYLLPTYKWSSLSWGGVFSGFP
jgi:SNW domain-containing protein 1